MDIRERLKTLEPDCPSPSCSNVMDYMTSDLDSTAHYQCKCGEREHFEPDGPGYVSRPYRPFSTPGLLLILVGFAAFFFSDDHQVLGVLGAVAGIALTGYSRESR